LEREAEALANLGAVASRHVLRSELFEDNDEFFEHADAEE
jgi:hypothetical protein